MGEDACLRRVAFLGKYTNLLCKIRSKPALLARASAPQKTFFIWGPFRVKMLLGLLACKQLFATNWQIYKFNFTLHAVT